MVGPYRETPELDADMAREKSRAVRKAASDLADVSHVLKLVLDATAKGHYCVWVKGPLSWAERDRLEDLGYVVEREWGSLYDKEERHSISWGKTSEARVR